jgi:nucleoside-diphosphate-sugar epimerase
MQKKISILGCGWLGLPLANNLIELNYIIKGSTTSEEKLHTLKEAGIEPYLITLTENELIGNVSDFLKDSEYLIINIPPKLRSHNSENFVKKINLLIPLIEKSTIKKVLFISSTSVYGELPISLNQKAVIFSEETKAIPDTESGKQLLEAENFLQRNSNFSTTIIRFGGLIGDDRQPVKHLSGKQDIENPDAPVNLIHLKDCIEIIKKTIMNTNTVLIWNQIFNAVAPFHPSRNDYYTSKAKKLNLVAPIFKKNTISKGKIVNGEKIISTINYQFNLDLYI